MERQPSEWKTITTNETTDKKLSSKIYKPYMKLNTRKMKNPIKKWAKELNRHFSKANTKMVNRYLEMCSISLIIKEMQIKTTPYTY